MAVSKQELKQRAIAAIDKNRDKIIALGDSIFSEPELGYKEVKTSAKLKAGWRGHHRCSRPPEGQRV